LGAYGDRGYGDGFKQGLGEKRAGGDQEGKGSRGKGHGPGGLCRETAGAAPFSPENLFSQSFSRSEQRGQFYTAVYIHWFKIFLETGSESWHLQVAGWCLTQKSDR
jgi:hypothetical protein